ncbi:MAG: hypothetical protein AB1Y26_07480 [Cycloclasticus sp.]
MKKITLKQNGTFDHVWLKSIHTIPESAIEVSNADFMLLSQNTNSKRYDIATATVLDYVPDFVIGDAKNIKHSEIRTAFNTGSVLPVTDANSDVWSGGFDSALKIDAAKRMAEMAGLTAVSIFDAANVEHALSLAEADVVILTLGADYQTKFAQKQALMTAVDALGETATQADLDAIVVAF